MNLKDKIVVITGVTGGIGRELVKNLDKEGAFLVLISRTESELINLLGKLENKKSTYYVCDFTDQDETRRVAEKVAREVGQIDILISGAGIGIYKSIEEASLKDWNDSMNVVAFSAFLFMKYLLPSLGKSDESMVMNIGSGAGVIPMAGRSLYCTAKFALRGLTLSLAEEYKRIGKPKFCLITLGSTLTSFGPLSLEEKKREALVGKAYFTPGWVGKKLIEIIKDDNREVEYTLYPSDYGFGSWQKPEAKKPL